MTKQKFKRAMGVKRQVYDFKNRNFDDLSVSLSRVPSYMGETHCKYMFNCKQ